LPNSTLVEIAQLLDSAIDAEPRLRRCLAILRNFLRADQCSLLVDADGVPKTVICVPDPEPSQLSALTKWLDGLFAGGESHPGGLSGEGWRVALPLVGLDCVVGFVVAERHSSSFTTHDLEVMSVAAAQLGAYVAMLSLHRKAVALDRFKEEMLAVLVHDLKNPMTAIIGLVEVVGDDLKDSGQETKDSLDDVRTASGRVLRIIANILDLTRLESKQLRLQTRATSFHAIIGPLLRQRSAQARLRRIELSFIPSDVDLHLMVDEDVFTRVLENIVDNALRYTPAGGRIEVSASQAGASRAHIRIGNTGPAIPEHAREMIFEKFGQAAASGRMNLGLGLYFSRLAVESHGGKIWVEENPALPAVFVLEVPLS
jgi:signal transduction histidine kinase